jgi:sRNA-binding regulator protein Hfq
MKSKLFIIFIAAYLLTGCAGAISDYKKLGDLLYSADDCNKLLKLAEKRFGKLTEADKKLFNAVAAAEGANYTEGGDKDKPEDANRWGEIRIIDANRIEWLCSNKQAKEIVSDKGIQIAGAKVKGVFDLSFAEISFPLRFVSCVFTEEINMRSSRIKFLNLVGSHTGSIRADGVKVEGGVFLRNGFKAKGGVYFPRATIDGDFDCSNGEFINKGGKAIIADRIDVKGTVFLSDGFKAEGEVRFTGATMGDFYCEKGSFVNENGIAIFADGMDVKGGVLLRNGFKAKGEVNFGGTMIGGNFICNKGEFINENGMAILADRMDIKGSVFLGDGFKSKGEVCFLGAAIGGDFYCGNGEFINKGGTAISTDGIGVKGSVFLRNDFKSEGEVRFPEAVIGGDFDCRNGKFINENGISIFAYRMDIKGGVFLRNGFKSEGEVRFPGAVIGGDFDCTDGNFIKGKEYAILADGMDVKGNVLLGDGFKAEGEVRFLGAAIGGEFYCGNGEFINDSNTAISADGIGVKGDVFLGDGFRAEGEVGFPGAAIGGDFVCQKGEFINENGTALLADGMDVKSIVFLGNGFKVEGRVSLVGATIGEHFFWHNVNLTEKTILDLRNAKTGVLWDDANCWPAKGKLFLDGFVYENIGVYAPKDAKSRIEWLNRQDANQFQPGPYEQLAKVLEKMGHNEDAIKIHIEKEERLTRLSSFGWWTRLWKGSTIGYGYRPWCALNWMGGFIGFGFVLFGIGYISGVIVPVEKDAYLFGGHQLRKGYPRFTILWCLGALIYSVEMFVPVIDLRMAKYWIPDTNKWLGAIICVYMWIHIIFGWILTTLLIVGLTGLIK